MPCFSSRLKYSSSVRQSICEVETTEKIFLLFDLSFVYWRDRLAFAGDLCGHTLITLLIARGSMSR